MCGMQPFDADEPMHGVIVTREGLECHDAIEFEYYSNPKLAMSWFRADLCAYCAGSSGANGFVDEELTIEWKSVLPVCQHCRAEGALLLARTKRRNGGRNARRETRVRLTALAPQAAVADGVSPVEGSDIPP